MALPSGRINKSQKTKKNKKPTKTKKIKKLIKDKKFFYVLFLSKFDTLVSGKYKHFTMTLKDTVAFFIFLTFLVGFSQAMYKIYEYDKEVYWSLITIIGCLLS